jgi:hypothetical protein
MMASVTLPDAISSISLATKLAIFEYAGSTRRGHAWRAGQINPHPYDRRPRPCPREQSFGRSFQCSLRTNGKKPPDGAARKRLLTLGAGATNPPVFRAKQCFARQSVRCKFLSNRPKNQGFETTSEESSMTITKIHKNDLATICFGNGIDVLNSFDDASVDLIFADPPYNIGKKFGNFSDTWPSDLDYAKWCFNWLG